VWSRFSDYVISYILDWLVQTVCIIWFCCLATVRKAYLCWFGLVLLSQLFFVARQRPDILRHSSHVFLGAVLDSVRTVLLFFWALWLFYGNECTDHKVSVTIVWFTTNGMCVKNTTIICVARASISKRDCEHDFYCFLLPRCEALRTYRSGFPIATKWCCDQDVKVVPSSAFTQRTCDRWASL